MAFKPSQEAKNWTALSKALKADKSDRDYAVSFHTDAPAAFKPHFARVKKKIAKVEAAQARLVQAAKSLPKLHKSLYAQAAKLDGVVSTITKLETEIVAKEKEVKAAPGDKTLKREFDTLVKEHKSRLSVLKKMRAAFGEIEKNFDRVGSDAYQSGLVAQDIQGM